MENTPSQSSENRMFRIKLHSRWYDFFLQMVVIFVSITVSFWFNEWREKQKNRSLEVFYLEQIKADVKEDIKELMGDIRSYLYLKKGYTFYRDYDIGQNRYPDSLQFYSGIFFRETYPVTNDLGFKTMQISGKLDVISDPAILRQLLKTYQESLPTLTNAIEGYLRFRREEISPFILKKFNFNNKTQQTNIAEMFKNQEFHNLVSFGSLSFDEIIERYQKLMEEYKKLQKMIDEELKKQ
jgi:hypothetical protein